MTTLREALIANREELKARKRELGIPDDCLKHARKPMNKRTPSKIALLRKIDEVRRANGGESYFASGLD